MRLGKTHPALRRCWHPVARSVEVGEGPLRFELLGEPYVAWRVRGELVVFADRCPHRFAPLSLGRREGELIRCAHHGWCYDPSGRCVRIPALGADAHIPPSARLESPAAICERLGMVLVAPVDPVTALPEVPETEVEATGPARS